MNTIEPTLIQKKELAKRLSISPRTIDGWVALDEHEIALGAPQGRARVEVVDSDEMIAISRP